MSLSEISEMERRSTLDKSPKIRKRQKYRVRKTQTQSERKNMRKSTEPHGEEFEKITEFDVAEQLFLPDYSKDNVTTKTDELIDFPKNYNVTEYLSLNTEKKRRDYRNSKDLRKYASSELQSEFDDRVCYTLYRGQQCVDETCHFNHEFRLPKKLSLCTHWMKASCTKGDLCLYLHSEFPCRFYYLGLKHARQDSKNCRYFHGGALSKAFEKMFLESIDLSVFPNAEQMYRNRIIQLKEQKVGGTWRPKKEAESNVACEKTSAGSLMESSKSMVIQGDEPNDVEHKAEADADGFINDAM
ncbi:Zinc finger CCCH domain-containing protein 6 [Pseudolycoriella hygida]|uniref:Zinc finger CCCH domain-containing protein 6 n=1 Tax=Pseudolycoriella hygida TaxID=35572 RepID=A0A9Q0RYH2_9DIPT|nr:Zinc finger CCCH domain-containing protein 6 [Pseudolycoriella hygida]